MHFNHLIVIASIAMTSCNDESKLRELENRIESGEQEIHNLRKELIHQKIDSEFRGYAFLRPGAQGFSTINLEIGSVTVSMTNVQEYANGSKATLRFGNPHTAQINKVSFDVDYGPLNDSGSLIENQKKTKKITIMDPLRRATWTETTIVLEGIMPAQLGEIKIYNPTFEGIELFQFK